MANILDGRWFGTYSDEKPIVVGKILGQVNDNAFLVQRGAGAFKQILSVAALKQYEFFDSEEDAREWYREISEKDEQ
jgi:hypothetical protein